MGPNADADLPILDVRGHLATLIPHYLSVFSRTIEKLTTVTNEIYKADLFSMR